MSRKRNKKLMASAGSLLVALALTAGSLGAQQRVVSGRIHSGSGMDPVVEVDDAIRAPAPWIQEDPGATAYAQAREALNAGRYREAAAAFEQLRSDFPRSGYLPDSYYYQAFSLFRMGGRGELQEARSLLQSMQENFREGASTLRDAEELLLRVESQLARQGDPRAARAITQQATQECGPDHEMKVAALNALMNMNPDRALPILQEVLQNRDVCGAELRAQAVFLIAQQMDEASVDILLDLAHRNPDPDPEVREQAVFWLSQVHSEEALEALESILMEADDPEIQENALFALSQHGSDRGGRILRDYIQRDDVPAELKENAVFWIGQSPGGSAYLRSVWSRFDDPELKDNALHAIAQAGDDESRAWLVERARDRSEDVEVRTNALFWASQTGAFTVDELRDLFNSFSDPEMKEQLIFAASQRGETEAVDFLMEIAEDPENGELREQAIFWLGQSDDPRVPEFLLRIIGR